MSQIRAIGECELRPEVPCAGTLTGLLEFERGVLGAYSCCQSGLVNAVKVFSEKIETVLTLVENLATEIFIGRAVAVGFVIDSPCEARLRPVLYVVGFDTIGLVAVLDRGVDI